MFKTDPGLVPLEFRPDLWWLDRSLVWTQPGLVITIPKGFITDDASTPKLLDFIPFLDRQGLSRLPGLLHDGIYSLGRKMGKDFADGVLRQACLSEGMSAFQAACYYRAVHWFGDSSWEGDARHGTAACVQGGYFITSALYNRYIASGGSIYSKP